jgi:hypothetical protein
LGDRLGFGAGGRLNWHDEIANRRDDGRFKCINELSWEIDRRFEKPTLFRVRV